MAVTETFYYGLQVVQLFSLSAGSVLLEKHSSLVQITLTVIQIAVEKALTPFEILAWKSRIIYKDMEIQGY